MGIRKGAEVYLNGYRDGNSVEASAKCLAFVAGDYELSPLLLLMMSFFYFVFDLEKCDVLRKDNINSPAGEDRCLVSIRPR